MSRGLTSRDGGPHTSGSGIVGRRDVSRRGHVFTIAEVRSVMAKDDRTIWEKIVAERKIAVHEPDGQTELLIEVAMEGYVSQKSVERPSSGASETLRFHLKRLTAHDFVGVYKCESPPPAGTHYVQITADGDSVSIKWQKYPDLRSEDVRVVQGALVWTSKPPQGTETYSLRRSTDGTLTLIWKNHLGPGKRTLEKVPSGRLPPDTGGYPGGAPGMPGMRR